MFKNFKKQIQNRFAELIKDQPALFITDIDKEVLWNTYLESFTDPIERQDHNCNCCKQFIRNYGNIVAIINNRIVTIWDFIVNEEYLNTQQNLNRLVLNSKICDIFLSETQRIGTDISTQRYTADATGKQTTLDTPITWNHICLDLPKECVVETKGNKMVVLSIDSIKGNKRDERNVFKRSLDELSIDAIETVLELISQNSLYRGDEFKGIIVEFLKSKKEYDSLSTIDRENYTWIKAQYLHVSILKIRNSSIGTLLTDISEGKELDFAVSAFERMVAPTNYKRPSEIVTKRMIEEAEKTITELGYTDSLERRYATVEDISVNNVLFVNRDLKKNLGVFDKMKDDVEINPKSLSKIEEIYIDTFIKDVLPTAKGLEMLFEKKHLNNLMSVITEKNEGSSIMFKWGNPFSWYYTNAVTDSIKEQVKAAGGKVDGVLRFSIQWNEDGKSICDLDAHAFEPDGAHIYYSTYKGRPTSMTGMLDVDMIRPKNVGVENITWSDLSKMKEGVYKFVIENYDSGINTGWNAQIEFNGEIYNFSSNKRLAAKIAVAEVTYSKSKGFSITSLVDSTMSAAASVDKWSMSTNKFQKVSMVMNSPNHWNNEIGNKHLFFILDSAKNDESVRGFFNEFLKEDLLKNKRVFEVLGSKFKVESSDRQLSGLGFSTTQRNSIICRVEGKFQRLLKINF